MTALNLDTYSLSLITAKEDILSDRSSTDWAVFTYEKKWSLKLLDSGVGGLDELTRRFSKNLVQYGLCRVHDPNTGVQRVVLIHWVGDNVDASRREVTAQHLPSIRRFFKEANVLLGAQKVEDVTQEQVAQALSRVPPPARAFQRPRIAGSREVVGTNYMKTNPAAEMKISRREAFWQRSEREEERRKEMERMRLQEERLNLERDRIQRERLEEEERDRRIQEKEKLVEEQRKEQARMEAERRRLEKERWAQQQKEYEEELKGRFRRSQSIEMAAEAAALVSGRSLHPRDFFRQHDRSVSTSFSPPSTPSSPSKASSGFFHRTTPRYQRSVTESILTPTSRSPTFFQGFQKRDSFQAISPSIPQPCSPAFIFSKSPLPGPSPKVDSLPSFIPPPITASRVTPTQIIGGPPPPHSSHTSPPRPSSSDAPFRAEYVTISPAGHSADTLVTNVQDRPHHEECHSGEAPARLGGLYRAELVPVDSPATSRPEQQEVPNKAATTFSGERLTAIKATVSVSSPVTEIAFTYPSPIPEARISASPLNTQTAVSIPPPVLQDIPSVTPSAAEVKTPSLTGQVLSSALISQDRTLNVNSLTNETALSTDSYEPKMSIGSTSLVSLLAPIPYTPYSSTRASVLPISARPLIDSVHGYQPHVPHVTEALPVFTSILSERLPKPQPGLTQTEAPLVVPLPLLDSLPVCKSSTPQPTYDHIDLPESLTQSMVLPVTVSSDYQPNPNIPLPYSSSTSSSLPSRNSPQSEASLDNPLPWSSTASSLPSRSSPQSEPSHEILLPWSSSVSSSLISRSSPQSEVSNNITLPCSSCLPSSSSQSELSTDIPLPLSSSTSSSLPSRSSPQSELSNNITLQCSSSTSSSLPSMSLPQSIPTTDIPLPCSSTSSSRNSTQSELSTDIPLQWSSSTSSILASKGLPQSESSNNQTKVLSPDESQPNNIISDDLLLESLSVSLPIAFQSSSELQPCHIQVDSPTIGSPTEFLSLAESQLYNQNSDPQLLEYPPEFLSCDIGISAESDPNNIQTDILITQSSSSTIPINISAEFQSKPLLIPNGFPVSNIQDNIPLVKPLSSSFINERSTDAQSNNIVADNPLIKPTLGSSGPQDRRSIQDDIPLMEPLFRSLSSHPESSSEPPLFNTQDESLLEPQSFSNEGYSGPDLSILEPPPESSAFPSKNLTEPQLSNIQVESLAAPSTITTSTDSTGPSVQADIPLIEPLPESLPLTPEGLTKPPLINVQAEPSCKPPSTTTAVCSAPQLNNQAYMPLIKPLSVSSSILPGSLAEPQSNNIQSQSLAELPFITNGDYPGLQLYKDEADIPLAEPLPVSSVLAIERSSGPQSNNIEADSLPAPPMRSTADSPGPQLNNVQTEPLPQSTPVTNEGSAGCQLNIVRADTALEEVSLGSPSFPTKSSTEPQIYGMPESSTCTSTKSPRDPHLNTIQADIQLLESSPVLLFASEPIALSPESSLLSIQSTSSSESHPSDVRADNPLMGSSPLPTEHYYESQPNRGPTDIQQAEVLPRSSPLPTEHYYESQPNRGPTDIQPAEVLPRSSPQHTEDCYESQPNRGPTDIQQAEVLPRSSPLPTEHYYESQPNRGPTDIQQAEVLPRSSPQHTEDCYESQPNRGPTDIQQAEVLPRSSPLPTEHYYESQPNRGPTDVQQAEILPRSSPQPTEDCSKFQRTDIQTDIQLAEILLRSSILPAEHYSESRPSREQIVIQQAEVLPKSSPLPFEDYSNSQSIDIQNDIQQAELLPIPASLPTEGSFETQLNSIQTGTQIEEQLHLSYSLPPKGSSESQTIMQTDIQQAEVLHIPLSIPSAGSTESQPNDIQLAELLPTFSSLPNEDSSIPQSNNIQSDILQTEVILLTSYIPTESSADLNDVQPDNVLGHTLPLSTESSAECHIIQVDIPVLEGSSPSSLLTTDHSSDSHASSNRKDVQSPEFMAAAPSTENSPESQENDSLVHDSSSVPIDGFLDLQLNNVEADVPPQKPPPAPPTEAQPDYVQTGLSVTEFIFVEESSPITTDGSPEPLPHKVQEDSPFIETSLLPSPPSTENIPDAQLFNTNENCTPLLCIPSDESLPDILTSEGALSESPTVTTCPFSNTPGSVSKPNDGQSLPIALIEEVLHNQFLPPRHPSESSPASPIRSSSSLSEIVYAEKVVLVEDPHPGSPPVNGNLIALESVPTISPGELEVKPLSHVINIEEVIAIHDVLSSNNITVDEDPPSDSKLLHKPLTSNSSEALL
ncbi:mucin-6-like [Ranitomeya imitator]|uniref:mucin-6-like n=1 Tax=Ranitomeya imitator TaxID=111125 RepID=UPI0037E7D0B7